MDWVVEGRAWKFGDHLDAFDIVSMRVILETKFKPLDPQELGSHCFVDVIPDFPKKVKKGDFVVAGRDFGCGHGLHWEGPIAMKALGVSAVIAESFARDYYRTSWNFGVPLLTCKGISEGVAQGDVLNVDMKAGVVRNLTSGKTLQADPAPPLLMEIQEAGGLTNYVKSRTGAARA